MMCEGPLPLRLCFLHVQTPPRTQPSSALLLIRNLQTLSKTLNNELLARGAAVDVLDVVGCALKVTAGVVALGDEDVVGTAVVGGLVDGDRSTLVGVSFFITLMLPNIHPLTMNCSSICPRRSKPGWSSRWWLAPVSAMVETMAIQ